MCLVILALIVVGELLGNREGDRDKTKATGGCFLSRRMGLAIKMIHCMEYICDAAVTRLWLFCGFLESCCRVLPCIIHVAF